MGNNMDLMLFRTKVYIYKILNKFFFSFRFVLMKTDKFFLEVP